MTGNEVLIVSKRIIPAYQLATLLEANGFCPYVNYTQDKYAATLAQYPSLLVMDIDDADMCGMEMARQYLLKPRLSWFALCVGGNTPAMQQARSLKVGGFFFLSPSGMALDRKRGAAHLLHKRGRAVKHHDDFARSHQSTRGRISISDNNGGHQ